LSKTRGLAFNTVRQAAHFARGSSEPVFRPTLHPTPRRGWGNSSWDQAARW